MKTNIIAEIGWSHLGDMSLAKEMIFAAAENGATHVKTQVFNEKFLKQGPWDTDGRREIYKKAQLSKDQLLSLKEYSDKNNIVFFASVMSVRDAVFYSEVINNIVKIPSFESRNINLLKFVNHSFDKIIVSTGTSTIDEIRESIKFLDLRKTVILHCVSSYPCKYKDANLQKIIEIRELIKDRIHYKCYKNINLLKCTGYSDHIKGIESCKVALEYNIGWIEKHFTINRNLPGRDNKFAILPNDLKKLSKYIEIKEKMNEFHGDDVLMCENDARIIQTGRFASDENNSYI